MIDNLAKIALDKGGTLTPLKIPSEETKGTGLCNPSLYLDKDGTLLCNIRCTIQKITNSFKEDGVL